MYIVLISGCSVQGPAVENVELMLTNRTAITIDIVATPINIIDDIGLDYERLSINDVDRNTWCLMCNVGTGVSNKWRIGTKPGDEYLFIARDSATNVIIYRRILTFSEFKNSEWTVVFQDQR